MTGTHYLELTDVDWLRTEYVERGLSTAMIGSLLGCNQQTVANALHRHGIPVRGKWSGRWNPKPCSVCGNTFTPTGPAAIFCSPTCRYGSAVCEECGETFVRRPDQTGTKGAKAPKDNRFCSAACRRVAGARTKGPPVRVAATGTFRCRDCKSEFPVEESVKDGRRPSGIMERCAPCHRIRCGSYRRNPSYADDQRTRVRDTMAKARWKALGIDPEQYQSLLDAQGGRCAICRTDQPSHSNGQQAVYFSVDHCHVTGEVRGLLCRQCNLGIGNLGDDPERLRSALAYIEAFIVLPGEGPVAPAPGGERWDPPVSAGAT